MAGPVGVLLGRAFAWMSDLEDGFTITLSDISCEDYEAMRAVKAERAKYLDEKRKVEEWRSRPK